MSAAGQAPEIATKTARTGRRDTPRSRRRSEPSAPGETPEPGGLAPRSSYLPGLDGLRALAVIAVLIYHARPGWLPGGFLGVEVFFVISGFIITRALLNEWHEHGRISLRDFWLRRARRLLPAVLLLLVGVVAYALVFEPAEVARLRGDVLASLAYVTNWHLIAGGQGYFDSFAQPSLLQHLWSLAVEEQFYIVWPLVIAFGLPLLRKQGVLLLIVAGIAASSIGMALLYDPAGNASRVYFGTDTRAAGLLVGAALAFVLSGRVPSLERRWSRVLLAAIGAAGLAALGYASYWMDDTRSFLYQGGFLSVSLCTAAVIVAATQMNLFSRAMSLPLLRWVGVRSYGIYLWHWPIYMTVWPAEPTLVQLAWQLPAIILISAASYSFLEQPVRRGALGRLRRRMPAWPREFQAGMSFAGGATAAALVGLIALMAVAKPPQLPDYFGMTGIQIRNTIVATDAGSVVRGPTAMGVVQTTLTSLTTDRRECPYDHVAPEDHELSVSSAPWGPGCPVALSIFQPPPAAKLAGGSILAITTGPTDEDFLAMHSPPLLQEPAVLDAVAEEEEGSPPQVEPQAPPAPPVQPVQTYTPPPVMTSAPAVTALGDSVMLGAAYSLAGSVPGIDLDSSVGRQAANMTALIRERSAAGMLGQVVILHVGNNGELTRAQFDEMMAAIGPDRHVLVLSLYVPRAWEASNNAVIYDGVARWGNASLVDWGGVVRSQSGLVHTDGIHLTPAGAAMYTQLIVTALGG